MYIMEVGQTPHCSFAYHLRHPTAEVAGSREPGRRTAGNWSLDLSSLDLTLKLNFFPALL